MAYEHQRIKSTFYGATMAEALENHNADALLYDRAIALVAVSIRRLAGTVECRWAGREGERVARFGIVSELRPCPSNDGAFFMTSTPAKVNEISNPATFGPNAPRSES